MRKASSKPAHILENEAYYRFTIIILYLPFSGIGLVMNYFEKKGWLDDMLIILTADNGVPFPGAKTNLYDPGANLPFMVSDPRDKTMWGSVSDRMVCVLREL